MAARAPWRCLRFALLVVALWRCCVVPWCGESRNLLAAGPLSLAQRVASQRWPVGASVVHVCCCIRVASQVLARTVSGAGCWGFIALGPGALPVVLQQFCTLSPELFQNSFRFGAACSVRSRLHSIEYLIVALERVSCGRPRWAVVVLFPRWGSLAGGC